MYVGAVEEMMSIVWVCVIKGVWWILCKYDLRKADFISSELVKGDAGKCV